MYGNVSEFNENYFQQNRIECLINPPMGNYAVQYIQYQAKQRDEYHKLKVNKL